MISLLFNICKKEPGLNLLYDANEVNSMNVKSKVK